jgi:hypothetical protein
MFLTPLAGTPVVLARTIQLGARHAESKNLGVIETFNFSEREPVSN